MSKYTPTTAVRFSLDLPIAGDPDLNEDREVGEFLTHDELKTLSDAAVLSRIQDEAEEWAREQIVVSVHFGAE